MVAFRSHRDWIYILTNSTHLYVAQLSCLSVCWPWRSTGPPIAAPAAPREEQKNVMCHGDKHSTWLSSPPPIHERPPGCLRRWQSRDTTSVQIRPRTIFCQLGTVDTACFSNATVVKAPELSLRFTYFSVRKCLTKFCLLELTQKLFWGGIGGKHI